MKYRSNLTIAHCHSRTALTLASALAALLACHSAQATAISWTGTTSTVWSLAGNWAGLVAPADSLTTDSAVLSGTPPANLPALTSNRSVGGLQFGATGGWTLGGGSILTLGNIQTVGSTTGVGIDASTLTSGSDTISCNITLGTTASQTWLVGTGGTLNVTGVVAKGTGSSILNVGNTSYGGTLVLGGTVDNNSLGLNITNGIVVLNKTSNSGNHALGVDTTVSGGTLQLAGTGGDQIYYQAGLTVNSTGTLDMNGRDEGIRALASTSGGTVTNSDLVTASTLTVTAGGNYAGAFTGNLSVIVGGAGNTGGSTFSGSVNNGGTITNSGSNATTISGPIGANVTGVIQNSATSALSLSGTNSFSGGITIKAGTVNVRSKALGSDNAHNVGTITLGDTANTGLAATLNVNEDGIGSSGGGAGSNPINVVGTGSRTISVTSWAPIFSGAVTLNGTDLNVITNNTGGSDMTLSGGFTGTGNLILQSNAVTTTKTSRINLTGTSVNNTGTITNSGTGTITTGNINTTISAAIGANVTGVIQNSAKSALILSGANTYPGNTAVRNGTLSFNSVAAGATAQALGKSNTVNLGAAGTSSGILSYTGGAGTLDKNVNVLGNGSDTIQNSGSGLLTLSGTLTKNGTILNLKGGSYGINVTGTIAGASANSDLVVNSGTVTLSAANSYNGPTFVNTGATLALGINNAIPGNSAVTLGDAGTTGALTMGAYTNSIASLAFGAGGGTLKLAANQTATAQLAASGTVVLGTTNTLDLTGMGTSAGLYKLVSGSSLSGTFSTVTGLNSAYTLKYGTVNANELDAQHKATAVLALGSNAPNVRVGSQTVNLSIGNAAPTGSADLSYTLGGVTGSAGTRTAAAGSSTATGTYTAVAGVNSFNITATDANATNSPQSVAFSQTGYNLASAAGSQTVNLYTRPGVAVSTSLSLTNSHAASAPYQETLGTTGFAGTTTGFTASGSVTGIAGGASDSGSLSVGVTSGVVGSAGHYSGSTTLGLQTEAVNSSGLGSLGIGNQSVNLEVVAYDYATATFSKTGGAGSLSGSGTSYALNFGSGLLLNTDYTATFSLANGLFSSAYQDSLAGTYGILSGAFATTATNFGNVAAGGTDTFTVTFRTGTTGTYSSDLTFDGTSKNSQLGDSTLAGGTINISLNAVAIPEPRAALLGGLGMLALLRRRNRAVY